MELRKGKYYIVRYDKDDGRSEFLNIETGEFVLALRDATAFDTKYMAMPYHAKFNNDKHYNYTIRFYDN